MIPAFDENGQLPPGIHEASWDEFAERYGTNEHRKKLLTALRTLVLHLSAVECRSLFVDGSFTTNKLFPNDYDACWDSTGVKGELIAPILLCFTDEGKERMQEKYRGDIRLQSFSPVETNGTYLDFFQSDLDGNPKGIVRLKLKEVRV